MKGIDMDWRDFFHGAAVFVFVFTVLMAVSTGLWLAVSMVGCS